MLRAGAFGLKAITSASPNYHPCIEGRPEGYWGWYDSPTEYIRDCERRMKANQSTYRGSQDASNSPQKDWDMNAGWDGAMKMGKEGWSEGAEKVKSLLDKVDDEVRAMLPEQRITQRPAMVGGRVSVPAYLAGHPKQFMQMKRIAAQCKTVTLNVSVGISGGISSETYLIRGVALCALVQALERRRVRVELVISFANQVSSQSCPTGTIGAAVVVKKATEKLMPDWIAFCLAHPAWHRRLNFAWKEGLPNDYVQKQGGMHSDGYGQTITFEMPHAAITFPAQAFISDKQMLDFVRTNLEKIVAL